jgi:hypothetical protein
MKQKTPLRERFPERDPATLLEADRWITTLQNEIRVIENRLEDDSLTTEGEPIGPEEQVWTPEERKEWRSRTKRGLVWRLNRLDEIKLWIRNNECKQCIEFHKGGHVILVE